MAVIIRKTTKNDLPSISLLYNGRKSTEELSWLLRNPFDTSDFNSFVAVDENNDVVGVIGYAINDYTYMGKIWKGIAPFSWIVKEGNRGLIGIQLIMGIYKIGQFGFALQGSELAKTVYTVVKLKPLLNAQIYVKLLNPVKFCITSHRNIFFNLVKTFYYLPSLSFYRHRNNSACLEFVPYKGEQLTDNHNLQVFRPFEETERIKWLLDCPVLETYGFRILNGNGSYLGIIILYIKPGTLRGKIVYISHLGENKVLWKATLDFIIRFFQMKKCGSISVLAYNPILVSMLGRKRFIKYTKKYKVYLRDLNNELERIPLNTWHLTYFESDRGYISFNY